MLFWVIVFLSLSISVQNRTSNSEKPKHRPNKGKKIKNEFESLEISPMRFQAIQQIRGDPKILEMKLNLSVLMPGLGILIGRELKQFTSNRVGGPADILVFPKKFEEVQLLIDFAKKNRVPFTFLGRGTNVIVRDGGIRGIVILTRELSYFEVSGNEFTAGAGSGLEEAAYILLEHGKSNLEWSVGIPGSIGGAVYMNAGSFDGDVQGCLKSVKYVDDVGKIQTLRTGELNIKYRYSIFHKKSQWFILEATFNIKDGNAAEMAKRMQNTIQRRENLFPLEYPQHGSTFKKNGRWIERLNLQGTRIGGVMISKKQSNFFINVDQGTAADYEALINHAIAKVREASGVKLLKEVEFIGESVYGSGEKSDKN